MQLFSTAVFQTDCCTSILSHSIYAQLHMHDFLHRQKLYSIAMSDLSCKESDSVLTATARSARLIINQLTL